MNARARRRRGLVLLATAVACGGLAASEVNGRVREVEDRVGAPVAVLVAARDVPPGERLKRGDVELRNVPGRFAPPDGFAAPGDAVGLETAAGLTRGSYVTATAVGAGEGGGSGPAPLRRGERAIEVTVAGGEALAGAAPGSRVDVLVSTDPGEGAGRTQLALEGIQLLALRQGAVTETTPGGESEPGAAGSSVATLRVGVEQAVYLTAAQNYAREVRLLPRPAGDRIRGGRASVDADGL